MKKLIILISILIFPLNVFAYSDHILLGGNTIGIEVSSDGILIVGFYKINGKYNKSDLKIGDYIKKINNKDVYTLNDLTNEIEKYTKDKVVSVTYKRNNKEYTTNLNLVYDNDIYKTGLFVKDGIIGIGTLTYVDPKTKIYGALGHEIVESNSNSIVEIKDGSIFKNEILSIDKSYINHAGSKNAKYYYNKVFGNILKNTSYGIFGIYNSDINDMKLIEVGSIDDIKIGKSYIYTVLTKDKVEEFEINIVSINENLNTKNIVFEIVDEKLLDITGGIIQGMSGSPIIQNNKIVGVVTHVIVDNPKMGYGLFIESMLEEGEK